MFESLKKKALKRVILSSVIFIIAGIAAFAFFGKRLYYAVFGYVTFEELTPDQIHNQLVKVDLTQTFGYYMYEYKYDENTHQKLENTAYYYAFFTGSESEEIDYAIMGIEVPASNYHEMEEIADYYTNNGDFYPEPLTLYGEIKKMDDEQIQNLKESFGMTDQEFEEYCIPYYVNVFPSKASTDGIACLICVVGAVLLVLGIVRLIRAATGSSLNKIKADMAAAGCTETTMESDFNRAVTFDKGKDVRLGRLFTYYMSGATPRALSNSKMLWAYQITTTHRTNGIKTGTTYSVLIYADDPRNSVTLPMPNEATTQEFLKKINATLPWVVVGYTDELKKLFNKNRTQFLDLRYNTVEHTAVEPGFENPASIQ